MSDHSNPTPPSEPRITPDPMPLVAPLSERAVRAFQTRRSRFEYVGGLRPLRTIFARLLPVMERQRLEAEARAAQDRASEFDNYMEPEVQPPLVHRLLAVVDDLRFAAAELFDLATDDCRELNRGENVLAVQAGVRGGEVLAVARRIERMLEHEPTVETPFAPGLADACCFETVSGEVLAESPES